MDDGSTSAPYVGYYLLNQQGDVIAIVDESGTPIVRYGYNAWGKIDTDTSVTYSSTSTRAKKLFSYNALKYRGYYHDEETGFYYLGSRYYDPVIGRFVNPDTVDVLTVSPTSFTDKNLYAYCDNNPVMRADGDGQFWNVAVGAVIGGVISAAFEAANQLILQKTTGSSFDVGAVVAEGLSGAIVGGFKASGMGRIGQAIGKALGAVITESYAQSKSSDGFNAGAVIRKAGESAAEGFVDGPGLKSKGTPYGKVLSKNSQIRNKIKNNGYKSLEAGAKRLRQNLSTLNTVKKKITINQTKSMIKDHAKDRFESYIPGLYKWLKKNW